MAMAVAAHAVDAGVGFEVLLVAKVDQGVETVDGLDPNVTAIAAVTAVGATIFDELFPAKGHGAAASVTGADVNLALV